jgi:hypothetical protein
MQVGFVALEMGSGRAKNVRNILLKNLADVMLAALAWWAVGYAFAYGNSAGGVIGWAGARCGAVRCGAVRCGAVQARRDERAARGLRPTPPTNTGPVLLPAPPQNQKVLQILLRGGRRDRAASLVLQLGLLRRRVPNRQRLPRGAHAIGGLPGERWRGGGSHGRGRGLPAPAPGARASRPRDLLPAPHRPPARAAPPPPDRRPRRPSRWRSPPSSTPCWCTGCGRPAAGWAASRRAVRSISQAGRSST